MDQHGLVYPPNLLDALPVLHPKAPVRALSAAQFADVHLQHTLAHPPDNVLFPFLHGLEGDNHAQNTFFASSAFSSASGNRQAHHDNTRITPKVPPYRGLVWVVCEEDLERAGDHVTLRVLRRKPAPAPGVAVGAGAGAAEPTPSSSSDDSDGDDSEEDSVYGDDAVDEDEQDMLLMMEAQAAAAAASAGTGAGRGDKAVPASAFAISIDTAITPPPHAHAHTQGHGHGHASRRPSTASNSTSTSNSTSNSNSSSTSPSSPDLALDTGDDDEDVDSVLASPTLQIPMQVDAVHVVQSSSDADDDALAVADGILDSVGPLSSSAAADGKDEKHFAGTHMHPVAHRPTPVPVLPTTLAGGVVAGAGVAGLGISNAMNMNTTAIATEAADAISIDMLSTSSSSASASASASSSRSPASSTSTSSNSSSSSPSAASSPSEEADKQLHLDLSSSPPQEPQPPSSQITPSPQSAHPQFQYQPKRPTNPAAPPLLTSTFRPKELLRRSRAPRRNGVVQGQTQTQAQARADNRGLGQIRIPGRVVHVSEALGGPLGRRKEKEKDRDGDERDRDRDREEEGWEFVPARVPDGISLRNFGIQVPIYATLSDVIVYSPYGATPAALALARRFKTAIRTKRAERLQAAGLSGDSSEDEDEDMQHLSEEERDTKKREKEERDRRRAEFLEYNVFVLNAEEEEMRKAVPYLMMRVCGAGVPGGVAPHSLGQGQASASGSGKDQESVGDGHSASDVDALVDIGAHTDGPDGHVIELGLVEAEARRQRRKEMEEEEEREMEVDMVVDVDMTTDADAMDVDVDEHQTSSSSSSLEKANQDDDEARKDFEDNLHLIPNTVDFALREREEMRDLTKASEIISLPPLAAAVPLVAAVPLSSSSSTSTTTATANPNDTRPNSPRSIVPPPLNHASTSTHSSSSTHTHLDAEGDPSPVWDPRVGQVYLGNSGDVPLAPDVPSHFRHAASVPREEEAEEWDWAALTGHLRGLDGLEGYDLEQEEEEEATTKTRTKKLSEDDPFHYLSTNDPARGFGYDICVECHDLAPFPSGQHLRAAEEHLGMLDVMWRERWEKAWVAREERRVRTRKENRVDGEGEGDEEEKERIRKPPPTPPRPPPHANAVIHLPFPSSPSNSQATMVALMPVIRFLEKWIQPLPVPVPVVQPPPLPPLPPSQAVEAHTPTPEMKNLKMIGSVDPMKNAAGAAAPPPAASASASSRRWSSVTSLMPSFPSFPGVGSSTSKEQPNLSASANAAPTPPPTAPLPPHPARMRSMTSPSSSFQQPPVHPPTPVQARTRPLKILLYSSDGYTESSVPALSLLMAIKALLLPEAYLELQVEKRRSFFVYQGDLGILRRVESRLREEREREKEKERERERERERVAAGAYLSHLGGSINANGKRTAPAPVPTRGGYWSGSGTPVVPTTTSSPSSSGSGPAVGPGSSARPPPPAGQNAFMGRPAAKSVSFAHGHAPPLAAHYSQQPQQQPQHQVSVLPKIPGSSHNPLASQFEFGSLPAQGSTAQGTGIFTTRQPQAQPQMGGAVVKGRPRANTSPWLPSLFGGDHQSWFNDPRFDGSFPSRVLPFLYLGNLNHASNVYMLHALGITHVVSVGECALVPPPHHMALHGNATASSCHRPGPAAHFIPGKGPGGHGSLWIEEREGRIKVLDIKGVCDDGIDTLEPQLEPICDWIDKARQEGGQVLVHCRVGVSRSATVTIAYVMKHLGLPLVDAYLIVRSRRLSVLIQPNMRLLYNLCGWEIKLAKERANGDERKLKKELARTLTWPYLAKEVHALNEKYLH